MLGVFILKHLLLLLSDRIRTTNNMLGDCYTAAVVEELSRKELMALDAAAVNYQVSQGDASHRFLMYSTANLRICLLAPRTDTMADCWRVKRNWRHPLRACAMPSLWT